MSEYAARKCGGKRRHRSERKAEESARQTQIHVGEAMRAYECEFCKGWHVGAVAVHPRVAAEKPRKERYVQPPDELRGLVPPAPPAPI